MRRFVKVFAWIGIALLVLLLAGGAWFVLSVRAASKRADAMKAALHEAGEPVSFADVVPPPVPDAENAAVPLTEAFRILARAGQDALDADGGEDGSERAGGAREPAPDPYDVATIVADFGEDPWGAGEADLRLVRTWLDRRTGVTAQIAEALVRPQLRLEGLWTTVVDELEERARIESPIPGLRDVHRWMLADAGLAAREGRAEDAWQRLEDAVRLSDRALHDRIFIATLVRDTLVKATGRAMAALAYRHPPEAARRARLLALFAALEEADRLGRAFAGERAQGLDVYAHLRAGGALQVETSLYAAAMFAHDEVRFLERCERALGLLERPYHEVADAWEGAFDSDAERPWWAVISSMFEVVYPFVVRSDAETRVMLRAAQEALRMEGLRSADGTLPEGLERTVRALDPFTGRPLRCTRDADGGYLLYWLGPMEDVVWESEAADALGEADLVDADLGDQMWRVAARVSPSTR